MLYSTFIYVLSSDRPSWKTINSIFCIEEKKNPKKSASNLEGLKSFPAAESFFLLFGAKIMDYLFMQPNLISLK